MKKLLAWPLTKVRLHRVSAIQSEGRQAVAKRRLPFTAPVVFAGNIFLHVSESRIRMFPRSGDSLRWELDCFRLLHPDRLASFDGATLRLERLPGIPLRILLREGRLSRSVMRAAGRGLASAHATSSPHYQGAFSHGDPHLGNLLYDAEDGCVRLIDFETRHCRGLPEAERLADDLLVVALELIGTLPRRAWRSLVLSLLEGYSPNEVIRSALASRLEPALLFWEGVLWSSRAHLLGGERLRAELDALHALL